MAMINGNDAEADRSERSNEAGMSFAFVFGQSEL